MNCARSSRGLAALLLACLLALPLPVLAQPQAPRPAARAQQEPWVELESGAGRVLELPAPAVTVVSGNQGVLRVRPLSPTSLYLLAGTAGRTTVLATAENGTVVAQYRVLVHPTPEEAAATQPATAARPSAGLAAMQRMLRSSVPASQNVHLAQAEGVLTLSGTVPTPADAQRVVGLIRAMAGEEAQVLNHLTVTSSIQVNLRVRIAEISRQITRDLGLSWTVLGSSSGWTLGLRTGLASAVPASAAILGAAPSAPSRLAMGFNSARHDINSIIDALAADQLVTILAEPNLTAQSGEAASFLAGGEFPIPVAATATGQVTIQFKQFGVGLSFVPTVFGPDRLNLRVRPEVSQLSDNGAISLPLATGTVTVPALTVRRAETTVELGSGQSFAIAGLLQRNVTQNNAGLAMLSEVPVLGPLFGSDRFQRNETELVIIVTPYLVQPAASPSEFAAPDDGFRPATDLERILLRRQTARGTPPARPVRLGLDAGFMLE